MRILSSLQSALVLGAVVASNAAAQTAACAPGPGAAFGITAYNCATCGFRQEKGERAVYSFFAEPVVTATAPGSAVAVGDVVEAVNGQPITTDAGGNQFTYPAPGPASITVRRGRDRQVLRVTVSDAQVCDRLPVAGNPSYHIGPTMRGDTIFLRGGAGARDWTRPLIIVDGVVVDGAAVNAADDGTGRFGFAVACRPSCTATTGRDGALQYTYYRYDGFPPVVAIRPGGPADRGGLRVGDLLVKIDGHLLVEDEGATRLGRIDRSDAVRLTVRRAGKDVDLSLRASP